MSKQVVKNRQAAIVIAPFCNPLGISYFLYFWIPRQGKKMHLLDGNSIELEVGKYIAKGSDN